MKKNSAVNANVRLNGTHYDTIVIGGGVLGLLAARALHDSGSKVLILDKGDLGRESSWAGGGILVPLYAWRESKLVQELSAFGHHYYRAFSQSLLAETGLDVECIQSGMLVSHLSEVEQIQAKNWAQNHRYAYAESSPEFLECLEPNLSKQCLKKACYFPDIFQIRNPRLLQALALSIKAKGVAHCCHVRVERVLSMNGRVTGVDLQDGGKIKADRVVVASGAWSSRLLRFDQMEVHPVRGQMIAFQTNPTFLKTIILHRSHYLIPRKDGLILCGSTLEDAGFDKRTTNEAKQLLQACAIEVLPELEQYPIKYQWSGLRPGSPNGIPYIGMHPDIKNLFFNTGHFRYGLTMSLASIKILMECMNGQQSGFDVSDYGVDALRL